MSPSDEEWRSLLTDCDLAMTRKVIAIVLAGKPLEKLPELVSRLYSEELRTVMAPFPNGPSLETAIALLKMAPALFSYLDACRPGGSLYFFNKYLDVSVQAWP